MARAGALIGIITRGAITVVRELAPGVIAVDNTDLHDVNIDPTIAVNCAGWDSLMVGVEIDGGSAPTMTVEALFRDPGAPDGARWKRMLHGARPGVTLAALAAEDTGVLDGTKLVELRTHGHSLVYFRVSAVANPTSTTGARILVMPSSRHWL